MSTLNRRSVLLGAMAAPAALVFPAEAEAAVQKFDLQAYLDGQSPKGRANWHMSRLAEAMNEVNPGYWHAAPVGSHQLAILINRDFERSKTMHAVQTSFIL